MGMSKTQEIPMTKRSPTQKLFDQIVRLGLLEDRREYDIDDLQSTYRLTRVEAAELFVRIQREFQ